MCVCFNLNGSIQKLSASDDDDDDDDDDGEGGIPFSSFMISRLGLNISAFSIY